MGKIRNPYHFLFRSKRTFKNSFHIPCQWQCPCSGHTECDAIIMDEASVQAVPEIAANCTDAALIHEAAIGKIAGEQIVKLMTLGLTEQQAEEQIISGFLEISNHQQRDEARLSVAPHTRYGNFIAEWIVTCSLERTRKPGFYILNMVG